MSFRCSGLELWPSWLQRVERGERLRITDRKRPIAEIVPIEPRRMTQEQWFAYLEERGELTRPKRRKFIDVKPARIRGKPLSQTILEERR